MVGIGFNTKNLNNSNISGFEDQSPLAMGSYNANND